MDAPLVGGQPSSIVVLVHGICSSAKTWQPLLQLLQTDEELSEFAFLSFEYSSPPFMLNPLKSIPDINVVADRLQTFLAMRTRNFSRVFLVSHSQGGLIVQRYLARQLTRGKGHDLARIERILLFACPNSGSQIFLTLRRSAFLWRHPQERDLRPLNEAVADAHRIVIDQIVNADAVASDRCPIEIRAYAGDKDGIVTPAAARGAFPNTGVLDGDHFTIIKPTGRDHDSYLALKDFLTQVDDGAESVLSRVARTTRSKIATEDVSSHRFDGSTIGSDYAMARWNPDSQTHDWYVPVNVAVRILENSHDVQPARDDAQVDPP